MIRHLSGKMRIAGSEVVPLVGPLLFCNGSGKEIGKIAMVRVVLRWMDSPWAFELMPGLNKLGRNPTNDFRVPDPSISSFHAEIIVDDQNVKVRDLGSTNGTFIDEQKVSEGVIRPEHGLRLGNVRFHLEEVVVNPLPHPTSPEGTVAASQDLSPACVNHPEKPATYKCQNCGAALCGNCVTVVGQGEFEATTICPVCQGQCHPLPQKAVPAQGSSLLHRLTQTLRIPFSR